MKTTFKVVSILLEYRCVYCGRMESIIKTKLGVFPREFFKECSNEKCKSKTLVELVEEEEVS